MSTLNKFFTCFVCLLPIFKIKNIILNYLGHKISYSSKIGFSIIFTNRLILQKNSVIKNFNLININKLYLRDKSIIGNFNIFRGNFNVIFFALSTIKNFNLLTRSKFFNGEDKSNLVLGKKSQITSLNTLDLAESILISGDSILAGKGVQLWTHGFFHTKDKNRNLITGKIKIGSNVYVGARVVINPGIKISNDINIGINLAVTQDLKETGIYFSGKPNLVRYDFDPKKFKISKIKNINYYQKR